MKIYMQILFDLADLDIVNHLFRQSYLTARR